MEKDHRCLMRPSWIWPLVQLLRIHPLNVSPDDIAPGSGEPYEVAVDGSRFIDHRPVYLFDFRGLVGLSIPRRAFLNMKEK